MQATIATILITCVQMDQAAKTIKTLRPDGRKGVTLLRTEYDRVSTSILNTLDTAAELTLNTLLDTILEHPEGDAGWRVLQIKLDLEARGLIKVYTPLYEKRMVYLKLTREGQRKVRFTRGQNTWDNNA